MPLMPPEMSDDAASHCRLRRRRALSFDADDIEIRHDDDADAPPFIYER